MSQTLVVGDLEHCLVTQIYQALLFCDLLFLLIFFVSVCVCLLLNETLLAHRRYEDALIGQKYQCGYVLVAHWLFCLNKSRRRS